jgi:uncharacterized protein with HEPN domain
MRREALEVAEMIDAAEEAHRLIEGVEMDALLADRQWSKPTQLHNRIVPGYWSIDAEILHTTASDQLPAFAAVLRRLLSDLAEQPTPPIG